MTDIQSYCFGIAVLLLAIQASAGRAQKTPGQTFPPPKAFSSSTTEPSPGLDRWWTLFHDPELDALLARTLRGNLDIETAAARLREARATLHYTQSSTALPSGGVVGQFSRNRTSQENPAVPKLGSSGASGSLIPRQYGVYQSYFDMSYELDLFGVNRHAVRAAIADAQSREEALRNTQISELAEVARDYMQLREYQQQEVIARSSLDSERETLRIVTVRVNLGLSTESDRTRIQAEVARLEAALPPIKTAQSQTIHALGTLLGVDPLSLQAELESQPKDVSTLPIVGTGLPSDLLRRRPDIREAERDLVSADESVKSQVAKLFPTITFSGQYGGQSGEVQNLADSAARYFTYGPQINWGFLNYPAARTNIRVYQARRDEKYASYKKTVLTAFREVDDALDALEQEWIHKHLLEAQLAATQTTLDSTQARYNSGLIDLLDVLDAQRSLNTVRDAFVQSEAALRTDTITLYKALGGGWEADDPALVTKKWTNQRSTHP